MLPVYGIAVDWAALGFDLNVQYRVTSVAIAWQTATSRTYTIAFGGSRAAPSLANRQGRYLTR